MIQCDRLRKFVKVEQKTTWTAEFQLGPLSFCKCAAGINTKKSMHLHVYTDSCMYTQTHSAAFRGNTTSLSSAIFLSLLWAGTGDIEHFSSLAKVPLNEYMYIMDCRYWTIKFIGATNRPWSGVLSNFVAVDSGYTCRTSGKFVIVVSLLLWNWPFFTGSITDNPYSLWI